MRSGDPDAEPMTLGAFVSEATAGEYIQRAYLGKDNKPTELLKKVTAAFDQLRAEFDASKPPPVPEGAARHRGRSSSPRRSPPSSSRRCS